MTAHTFDAGHDVVVDVASLADRHWFDEHPQSKSYARPPIEHELCQAVTGCFDHRGYWMKVVMLAPGLRARCLGRALS